MIERRKVELELYEADCEVLERTYGAQWPIVVRDWVNQRAFGVDRREALADIKNDLARTPISGPEIATNKLSNKII
jgi:hypothetical protein